MKKIVLCALGIAFIGGVTFGSAPVFAQGTVPAEQAQITELQAIVVQLLKIVAELQRQLLVRQLAEQAQVPVPAVPGCGQAEITWVSVPGATEYILYRTGLEVYKGKDLKFIDKGLAPGVQYAYTVRARNAGGLGPVSSVQTITIPSQCAPSAPFVWAQEGDVCGGNVQVFWTQVQGAGFYELFRGNTRAFSGTTLSFTDRGLTPSGSYKYKVRAGNSGGLGEFSQEASAKASVVCPPAAPKTPVVKDPVADNVAREGTFTVVIQGSPSGVTVESEGSGANVLAFRASAKLSPIFINRVDVEFSDRPWLFLSVIELREGSRILSKVEISQDSFVQTGDGRYRLSFSNFSVEVPEGGVKTISVFVVARGGLLVDPPKQLTVSIPANSLRGRDEAGITHQAPGAQEASAFVKSFFVKKKVIK